MEAPYSRNIARPFLKNIVLWTGVSLATLTALLLQSCNKSDNASDGIGTKLDPFVHDFGNVKLGENLKHKFQIINKSAELMEITSLTSTNLCTCHISLVDRKDKIFPGEFAEVAVDIPAVNAGSVLQTVRVTTKSRDQQPNEILLTVKASVVAEIEAIPSQIRIEVTKDNVASRILTVQSAILDVRKVIRDATSDSPFIQVERVGDSPGTVSFRVSVMPNCPSGTTFSKVRFRLEHNEIVELIVPVVVCRLTDLRTAPSSVIWSSERGIPSTARLLVYSGSQQPFSIVGLDVPDGLEIAYESDPTVPKARHAIKLTRTAHIGKGRHEVVLRTNKKDGRLTIPVEIY